ncbi:hypothetical protein GCM10009602_18740 [Nocardiopsis tropica]
MSAGRTPGAPGGQEELEAPGGTGPRREDPVDGTQRGGQTLSKAAALFLWAVVVVALGYGVVRTAVQAAALFTG